MAVLFQNLSRTCHFSWNPTALSTSLQCFNVFFAHAVLYYLQPFFFISMTNSIRGFWKHKIAISAQYENVSVWKYNDINVVKSFSYYANIFGSIKQVSLLKSTSITYPRASPEFGHCLNSVLVITVSKTFYLLVIWFIIVYLFYWFFFNVSCRWPCLYVWLVSLLCCALGV